MSSPSLSLSANNNLRSLRSMLVTFTSRLGLEVYPLPLLAQQESIASIQNQLGVVSKGAGLQVREKLPALVQAVQNSGQVVTWICDPMHGNTESCSGFKTRRYQNIRAEVCQPWRGLLYMCQMDASLKPPVSSIENCSFMHPTGSLAAMP